MKIGLLPLLLLLSALAFLPGCQKNAEGRKSLALIPDSLINSQSSAAYEQQKKEVPLSNNARQREITLRVGNRLIDVANQQYAQYCKGFKWEVQLFDQPDTVNAYCMPGGKIGIYTGILPVCENEAALAAVMGHEIAHALLKHGNERVTQQLGAQVALAAGQVGLAMKSGMDKKMQGVIIGAAGLGAQVGMLAYSRSHESEADRMGLRLMAMGGYDPQESVHLWERMKAKSGGKAPPVLLSTHPSNDQRIRDLQNMQGEVAAQYDASPKYGLGEKL